MRSDLSARRQHTINHHAGLAQVVNGVTQGFELRPVQVRVDFGVGFQDVDQRGSLIFLANTLAKAVRSDEIAIASAASTCKTLLSTSVPAGQAQSNAQLSRNLSVTTFNSSLGVRTRQTWRQRRAGLADLTISALTFTGGAIAPSCSLATRTQATMKKCAG